jgi:cytoskeletal protein RodZ
MLYSGSDATGCALQTKLLLLMLLLLTVQMLWVVLQTMLTIRRRLSPRTTLLHVSRSCRAPTEAVATSKASSSSSSDSDSDGNKDSSSSSSKESSTREVPLSEQVMQHGSSSSGSSSVDSKEADGSKVKSIALSGAAKALYPLSAVGGLNLLYFELAMLVILSGALPIVYVRKRRFVR